MNTTKEPFIVNYVHDIGFEYCKIKTSHQLDVVYDLLHNNKIEKEIPDDDIIWIYYGLYYVKKNRNLFDKFMNLAIAKGNADAMCLLGKMYQDEGNVTLMIRYYASAINCGNSLVMAYLGKYYLERGSYANMMTYLLMGLQKKEPLAMCYLGDYYLKVEDYVNMEKYYIMAFKHDNFSATLKLFKHYSESNNVNKLKEWVALMGKVEVSMEKLRQYTMSPK